MSRAVITGAAGFIGARLSLRFLSLDWDVVGVDRYASLPTDDVRSARAAALRRHERFEAVDADIAADALTDALQGAHLVVHLAALPGVRASWGPTFADYAGANVTGTQRVLDAVARTAPEARVIAASSSSVYGDHHRMPLAEAAELRPASPYGITKVAAEHLARLYAGDQGLDVVCARFFTVCGPGQRPDMGMSRIIASAHGGPEFTVFNREWTRDYTHVDDAVDALLALASAPRLPLLAYNIAGGQRASIPDVAALIAELLGKAPRITDGPGGRGDVGHTWADGAAIAADVGWTARRSLADAVRDQIADPSGIGPAA